MMCYGGRDLARAYRTVRANTIKIALTATRLSDALPLLPIVCREIDRLDGEAQFRAIIEGVFAGNVFDMGAEATAATASAVSSAEPAAGLGTRVRAPLRNFQIMARPRLRRLPRELARSELKRLVRRSSAKSASFPSTMSLTR